MDIRWDKGDVTTLKRGMVKMADAQKARALFEYVFERPFIDCDENRKKMQYLMYALNESGMTVGEYDTFMWRDEKNDERQ